MSCVSYPWLKTVASTLLNVTLFTPDKLVPNIVTCVPLVFGPELGLKNEIDGSGS